MEGGGGGLHVNSNHFPALFAERFICSDTVIELTRELPLTVCIRNQISRQSHEYSRMNQSSVWKRPQITQAASFFLKPWIHMNVFESFCNKSLVTGLFWALFHCGCVFSPLMFSCETVKRMCCAVLKHHWVQLSSKANQHLSAAAAMLRRLQRRLSNRNSLVTKATLITGVYTLWRCCILWLFTQCSTLDIGI